MALSTTRPNGLSSTLSRRRACGDCSGASPSVATAASASAGARATVSVNMVPPPLRWLATMSPPIARASCLTEDKPKPAPPKREAIVTLACENGRNSRLISAERQSDAAIRNCEGDGNFVLSAAQGLYRQRDPAPVGELHRVVDQVFERRAQTDGVADHKGRQFVGYFDRGLQALRRRAPHQGIAHAAGQGPQVEKILPGSRPAPRPRAASTNSVARLARCSAPALIVSTQRRSR